MSETSTLEPEVQNEETTVEQTEVQTAESNELRRLKDKMAEIEEQSRECDQLELDWTRAKSIANERKKAFDEATDELRQLIRDHRDGVNKLPFKEDEERLSVGAEFDFGEMRPTVTSFNDNEGYLTACTYKPSENRQKLKVIGESFQFLGNRNGGQQNGGQQQGQQNQGQHQQQGQGYHQPRQQQQQQLQGRVGADLSLPY